MKAKTVYRAVKEKDFQAQILEIAHLYGWLAYHTYDSKRCAPGYPDLALCHPQGDYLLIELKSERGRIRPEQQQWIDALQASGVEVHVYRPHQIDEVIARLQR